MIDFFGQKELYQKHKADYMKIIENTLENDSLLRGKSVGFFEDKVKTKIGRSNAIAVNSGTDAILISLLALGVKLGDEIIVTAYSFVASATPIKMLGAIPVFVDVDKDTCLIDSSKIEAVITKKTKGIIAVDLYGECFDYKKIQGICKEYDLFLLEDAAQAYGSKYNSQFAGTLGDVSTMSFDVSKVVYGITTAGVILTDDAFLTAKVRRLRGHGFNDQTREFEEIGYNSNVSSVNAAILSYKLDLDIELFKERERVRKFYDSKLTKIKEIKLLKRNSYSMGNNHKYVIFVEKRDELQKYLIGKNIPVKVHYDKPIPYYLNFNMDISVPNALYISKHILSLPIHPLLGEDDLEYIVNAIGDFFE